MKSGRLYNTVYFDNAATTWPKPAQVREAVSRALTIYGANPGRSGYQMSLSTSAKVYRCRELAAEFFNLADPSKVVFVQNCTMALNIVIKGLLRFGGRVVVSDLEHNAVMRPLYAISPKNSVFDVAAVYPGDIKRTLESFEKCIRPDTRAIVCLHASNVFGVRLPIREIGKLARKYGLAFVVDAAQSAGVAPIDMQADCIDYLCVPGHKGLYGPMGIGMLLCNSERVLPTIFEGGTGSFSTDLQQPADLPDRYESGTVNTPGILGLAAGIESIKTRGINTIAREEMELTAYIYNQLAEMDRVSLYTPKPDLSWSVPVLSFNIKGKNSEEVAEALSKKGIAVRAGLHCAPAAHRKYGTLNTGTVRIAPSVFTTIKDARYLCSVIREIEKDN